MASGSRYSTAITCQDLFLPQSLVKLVIDICKTYKISKYDQFSILDTLNFALFNNFKEHAINNEFKDQERMSMTIVNIVRLCEKFNNSSSSLVKKIDVIFKELGINKNVYNISELESYQLMNYEIKTPVILESIYDLIESYLDTNEEKNKVYDFANDVLVMLYYWKDRIYEE